MSDLEKAKELLNELPTMSTAIKNFISVYFASDVRTQLTSDSLKQKKLTTPQTLIVFKTLTKKINETRLIDPIQFFKQKEQGDTLAVDRLDEIASYKGHYVVLNAILKKEEKDFSIAKKTGREMLKFLYKLNNFKIRSDVLTELEKQGLNNDGVSNLLTAFEKTFLQDKGEYTDLVWSKNFNIALAKRNMNRASEIQKRRDDIKHNSVPDPEPSSAATDDIES
eukprot:augustus_masked-scaffold_19-processed-gene-0.31-mRNA-1 protein AED:1.00 eAED:1.00 QI:0/-1/0/0/-1/1/1/0/222